MTGQLGQAKMNFNDVDIHLSEMVIQMEERTELERDIHELQDKVGTALDYCLELYKRHGDQPGWEMVEDKLTVAIGWAAVPMNCFERSLGKKG